MTEKKMRVKRNRVSNTLRRLGIHEAASFYATKVNLYSGLTKQYRAELSTLSSGLYRDKLIRKIAQASCKLERYERFMYSLLLDEVHQRNRPYYTNKP